MGERGLAAKASATAVPVEPKPGMILFDSLSGRQGPQEGVTEDYSHKE